MAPRGEADKEYTCCTVCSQKLCVGFGSVLLYLKQYNMGNMVYLGTTNDRSVRWFFLYRNRYTIGARNTRAGEGSLPAIPLPMPAAVLTSLKQRRTPLK